MRAFSVFVLAGACLLAASSQAQTADEKELKRIELGTARLEQQNDVGLGNYLADDWVCVGPKRLSKAESLQNVKHNLDTGRPPTRRNFSRKTTPTCSHETRAAGICISRGSTP